MPTNLLALPLLAATASTAGAAPCAATFDVLLAGLDDGAPAAIDDPDAMPVGTYVAATPADRAAIALGIAAWFAGDETTAIATLATVGLELCTTTLDATSGVAVTVVHDPDGDDRTLSRGWAALAIRTPLPETPQVVLSVPHMMSELRVALQAREILANPAVPVAAAVFGPVHRCNRTEAAPMEFQGTTTQCGGTFRISDMAHVQDSAFQALHDAWWTARPQDRLVQIHGMAEPGFSVSQGTSDDTVDHPNAAVARLHERYLAELVPLGYATVSLTACSSHDGPHGTQQRELLCGTRNAQRAALAPLGEPLRFLHLEQGLDVRNVAQARQSLGPALVDVVAHLFADGFD